MEKTGQPVGRGIFRNEDTLAMALPSIVDLSLYTMLYQSVNEAAHDNIRYLLLDFSEAEKLCDSGIAAFMSLQKLINVMQIRLLMLDTPVEIYKQLEDILPGAFWIDMSQVDTFVDAGQEQGKTTKGH